MRDLTTEFLLGYNSEPKDQPDYPITDIRCIAWKFGRHLKSVDFPKPHSVAQDTEKNHDHFVVGAEGRQYTHWRYVGNDQFHMFDPLTGRNIREGMFTSFEKKR